MADKVKPRVPRGMRDILPEQMVRRQYVIDVIRGVFEEFGFEPLQTPAIELDEILRGKYGPDAERLIYSATYGDGQEKLSLRYDLSVPLCRVMAMYPDIPRPFKRYHIAPVWRAERPQKGRYREFYQCDADTVGSSSMLGDAETVAVIYTILSRLGFGEFTVYINNRKILNGIGQFAGVPESLLPGLYRSIDKLGKIGVEGVKQELLSVGIPSTVNDALRRVARLYLQGKLDLDAVGARLGEEKELLPEEVAAAVEADLKSVLAGQTPGEIPPDRVQEEAGKLLSGVTAALREVYGPTTDLIPDEVVDKLMTLLEIKGDSEEVLGSLRAQLGDSADALEGIAELEEMTRYLELLQVPEKFYEIDVSMARGLEYYTGPIYETIVKEPNVGSITGGGRYDNLIGMFREESLPATGTTIGIERIIVVMEEQGMFPPSIGKTSVQVLVAAFNQDTVDESVKLAVRLRQEGLRAQVYFDPDPLREQIGYAAKKEIPVIAILGPDEIESGQVSLRDLRNKNQETVKVEGAGDFIKEWLAGGD